MLHRRNLGINEILLHPIYMLTFCICSADLYADFLPWVEEIMVLHHLAQIVTNEHSFNAILRPKALKSQRKVMAGIAWQESCLYNSMLIWSWYPRSETSKILEIKPADNFEHRAVQLHLGNGWIDRFETSSCNDDDLVLNLKDLREMSLFSWNKKH